MHELMPHHHSLKMIFLIINIKKKKKKRKKKKKKKKMMMMMMMIFKYAFVSFTIVYKGLSKDNNYAKVMLIANSFFLIKRQFQGTVFSQNPNTNL